MLSHEDNERLTRVGPGTPAGEFLRRYWQPVALPPELSEANPTKLVCILGEDLVLFRDKTGRVGLLADHCPHRGASLLYGRVEERGIACAYHGWLYDTNGSCLETPAEPADSLLHLTVKHKAYPVREHYGLYWAYMGPEPAPLLPRVDVAELAPIRGVGQSARLDANWLHFVEQNVDQAHIFILHQDSRGFGGAAGSSTTRGRIDELGSLEYVEVPFGIKRTQIHRSGWSETDLMFMPAGLRIYDQFSMKVPIDDTHTTQFHIYADLPRNGGPAVDGPNSVWSSGRTVLKSEGSIEYFIETNGDGKSNPNAIHPAATYRMDRLRYQDYTILETQGAIQDRRGEHLATSDRGVALLRSILLREIEKVERGEDPIGVIREPGQELIDTYFESYVQTRAADPR